MRLHGALDNDVHAAVQKFLADGVSATVPDLYSTLQKSNSSLKRTKKKALQASIERVLEFIGVSDDEDSEAAIDDIHPEPDEEGEPMNRLLRANLAPQRRTPPPIPPIATAEEATNKRKSNGESLPKRQKRAAERINIEPPSNFSIRDIGGMNDVLCKMKQLIILPLLHPEIYLESNLPMPGGILLHGPPGCGKTLTARAFAALVQVPFIEILGPSIVSGMSGESERGVRERFEEAKKNAPCILFIDEIDAIAPKRDSSQSQMEKRIVAQLLVSMDELQQDPTKPVVVLAATNRPESIDPALRRGGRFGTEINITVPNGRARKRILEKLTKRINISSYVDFAELARMTAGFVGADLQDLVSKAGAHRLGQYEAALEKQADELCLNNQCPIDEDDEVKSIIALVERSKHKDLPRPKGFETLALSMSDFLAVLPDIIPSSKREGFTTVPDVSWADVGALESLRNQLESAIIRPIKSPELYQRMGDTVPSGVLLWGPPGCGKTLLAKAVASESQANFISVKGPELLNKFVGESEAAVRKVFLRARSSVPCVIFFDELDALVPRRDDSGSEASARVVNTLLTELDGLGTRVGIYVVGATNRPDMVDEAMLRPGRFGKQLFVDLPGPEERVQIMKALTRSRPTTITEEIEGIVRGDCCQNFSGADLAMLLNEAIDAAIERKSSVVELEDYRHATEKVRPSVADASARKYRQLSRTLK